MIYITFTGNNPYKTANYSYEGDDDFPVVEDKYIQSPVLKRYGESIKRIIVFLTEDQKCYDNFREIEKIAYTYDSEIKVEAVEYTLNDTFDELFEKMHGKIENNEEVILGITNTLRNIPFSVLQILPYIQAYKNLKIKHILYGKQDFTKKKEEHENVDIQIQDFIKYFYDSKIIVYLKQFIDSLKVPELYETFKGKKILSLFEKINCMNKVRLKSEILEELKRFKEIYSLCVVLSKEDTIYKRYLKDIIGELEWTQKGNIYIQMNHMAKYVLSKGYYQHAVTILDRNRTIVMAAILLYENEENMKKIQDTIECAESIMKVVDGTYKGKLKDEAKAMYDKLNRNVQKRISGFFLDDKDPNIKGLSEIRNTIDHGKSFKNAQRLEEVKLEIQKGIDDYFCRLNNLAGIKEIWCGNHVNLY